MEKLERKVKAARETGGRSSLEKLQKSIAGREASRVPSGTDRGQLSRLDKKMLELSPTSEARRRELSGRPLTANERNSMKRALERLKTKDR